MHLVPPAIVFVLILVGGFIAHTASGSPAVLFSVSGGVFLIALFARNLAVALPIAVGTGLVTFALALRGFVPWVGVAEALFLIAWAGSANVRHPIPAALAAGFFGSLVLAFEIWRGWSGDMVEHSLRPPLAIFSAAAGILLLMPGRQNQNPHALFASAPRSGSNRIPFAYTAGALACALCIILSTITLAGPLGKFAAHLREAFGGAVAGTGLTEMPVAGGSGSRWSTDSGRSLPLRSDFDLTHDFALLLRADNKSDANLLGSRQIYCRTVVFERYEKGRWLPPARNEWFEDPDDGAIDNRVRVGREPPGWILPIPHTVYVPVSPEIILPSLQGVFSFELPRIIRIGDSIFGHPSRLEFPLKYRARSAVRRIEDVPPEKLRPASPGSPDELELPEDRIGGRIRTLAASLSAPGTPMPVVVDRIRRHLDETTTYSTVIENPQNLPPLENFLFGERRGYCEFYATAGALLLRASGFPARTGYGFSGGERAADPLAFAFFSDDAHAWTEVNVEGVGWTVIDFTPEGQGAANPPATAGPLAPRVDRESFPSLRELDIEATGQWATAAAASGWDWGEFGWLASVAAALFLGGIAAVVLRREPASQHLARNAGSTLSNPAREPGFYRFFCDAAAKAGVPKRTGQTPKEHLADLAESAPQFAGEFKDLVDYYYAVRYEGAPASRSRERAFRGVAGRISKSS